MMRVRKSSATSTRLRIRAWTIRLTSGSAHASAAVTSARSSVSLLNRSSSSWAAYTAVGSTSSSSFLRERTRDIGLNKAVLSASRLGPRRVYAESSLVATPTSARMCKGSVTEAISSVRRWRMSDRM